MKGRDNKKVDLAKKAFGVTDETAQKKFLYGFFLDDYSPDSLAEQKIVEDLKKYQWFSSNLTAIYFSEELNRFLESKHVKNLNKLTIESVNNFIKYLSNSFDNGYIIDSCRAYHPGLAYLAATGNRSFAQLGGGFLKSSVEELVKSTVQKIANLSVGEKAVFLTGTILHETRVVVEKISEDEFEYSNHDSAAITTKTAKIFNTAKILDNALWKNVYNGKFSMCSGGWGEEISIDVSGVRHIDVSGVRHQEKSTCHFRCLYSILKSELLSLYIDQDEATIEWHKLKLIFGEWLLSNRASDDVNLQILSAKKQKEREQQFNVAQKMQSLIQQGEYKNLFDSFSQVLKLLSSKYANNLKIQYVTSQKNKTAGKLQILLSMRSVLIRNMKQKKIDTANLEPFFRRIKNINFEEFFEAYKDKKNLNADWFYKQLMLEIKENCSPSFPELARLKFLTSTLGYNQALNEYTPPHNYDSLRLKLNIDQLAEIIKILEKKPSLLSNLVLKPNLFTVVYDAFIEGMFDEVINIYNLLSVDDKKAFDYFSERYSSGVFLNISFDKIIDVYSNYDKYPKFFEYQIYRYLSYATMPQEFIHELLKTINTMVSQHKIPNDAIDIYCNVLRILLDESNVDNKEEVLTIRKVLNDFCNYLNLYPPSEEQKSILINNIHLLGKKLSSNNDVHVRFYFGKICSKIYSYKIVKEEVLKSIVNSGNKYAL